MWTAEDQRRAFETLAGKAPLPRPPPAGPAGMASTGALADYRSRSVAEVQQEIRRLDGEMQAFDDAVRSLAVPAELAQVSAGAWARDYASWRQFADHYASYWAINGITGTGTGEVARMNDDWRRKLVQWDALLRLGPDRSSPAEIAAKLPPAPFPPRQDRLAPPEAGWPWWATSALTIAGVGAVGYLGYATYRYVKGVTGQAEHAREIVEREVLPEPRSRREGMREIARDPAFDRFYGAGPGPDADVDFFGRRRASPLLEEPFDDFDGFDEDGYDREPPRPDSYRMFPPRGEGLVRRSGARAGLSRRPRGGRTW